MPTENRSSNTEMVSFPRELSDGLAELIAHRARVCGGGAFDIWEAICEGFAAPAQHHPAEPIAWMVGTAFWWTKEEAERDAAAMGLPIVGLGPMVGSAPTQQHQGEPVMRLECEKLWGGDGEYAVDFVKPGWLQECREKGGTFLLYTRAEPAEVERLRKENEGLRAGWHKDESDNNRYWPEQLQEAKSELAERDALLQDLLDYDISTNARRRIEEALSASPVPEVKS